MNIQRVVGDLVATSRVPTLQNRSPAIVYFRNGSAVMSPCAPMYSAASGTMTWAWQSTVVVLSRIGSVETLLAAVGP